MVEASPTKDRFKTLEQKVTKKKRSSTALRILKYTASRMVMMVITVTIGVYLTVLIANMGGYVDTIRKAQIREQVGLIVANDPVLRKLSPEVRNIRIAEMVRDQESIYGLDKPFLVRSFLYLKQALTLDLGRAMSMTSNSGSSSVRNIIIERLPPTLLLFGTSDLVLFFLALMIALSLSRHYGSVMDKIVIALTPLSSAPGWFYGIFLILIFAAVLRVLPFGGMVDAPPPKETMAYILSLLRHMLLPVAAITISSIFLSVFSWRTFFLIYSSEDYVEMAKAKGLTERDVTQKYILRPTLPTIITNFALLVIGMWVGAPIFETVFQWPGLGRALYQAIGLFDTPVIVAEAVIFSYLLGITVFLLEIVYALVDPRVQVGNEGPRA